MSTLQAVNLKHPSSTANNVVLDSGGNVTFGGNTTFAGTVAMASSFLRNRIINGDMRIDQRNAGASVTLTTSTYTLDRWRGEVVNGGGGAYSVQRSTLAPAGFTNSALITVTTADSSIASTDFYDFQQFIEGFNVADLGWGTADAQTVTLSFWVRSSLTGTFSGSVSNGAANRSYVFSYAISAANTWERKTVTIPGDTSGTWLTDNGRGLLLTFDLGNGSAYTQSSAGSWVATYAAGLTSAVKVISTNGATFYLTGVQLEVGSAATPFERRQYGQELALCQRYYTKSYNTNVAVPSISNDGCILAVAVTTSIGGLGATIQFPVEMRASPTMTFYSPTSLTPGLWRDGGSGTDKAVAVYVAAGTRAVQVLNNATWSGAGAAGFGHYVASAEL